MSQLLQFAIPIRLVCYRIPATWRYEKGATGEVSYVCMVAENFLSGVFEEATPQRFEQFDPWEMRLEFLRVDLDDPTSVVSFLNKVGLFAPLRAEVADDDRVIAVGAEDGQHVISYDPARAWTQDDFREDQLFCRDWPCQLVDSNQAELKARVAPVNGAPTLFVTATNFYDAYQAAFAVDQIRRARRAKCKRPGCGNTYVFTGNRKRKYCDGRCGHYMAVQSNRRRQRKEKRPAKRRTD